ncbi:MAG: hypothetical protein HGB19_06275 [Chlorobiales bacterium]|nr:hypothetical protein [Chlorobiales bacterium]
MKRVFVAVTEALLLLMVFGTPAVAMVDPQNLFKDANRAYTRGQYAEALQKYRSIDSAGYQSGELYYNMGNACYKLGQAGPSILYYEKARQFLKEDEDLQNNLELARLKAQDKISEVPKFFLTSLAEAFLGWFSLDMLGYLTLGMIYLLTLALILKMRGSLSPLTGKALVITLLVLSLFSATTFAAKSYLAATVKEAVVLAPVVNAKSEPNESSSTLFIIHEGLKVGVSQQQGEWLEIRLPDGNKGWIPFKEAGMI